MASAVSDHNYNSSAVFKLIFAAGSQLHGATAAFLTPTTGALGQGNNQTITDVMSRYWISFVVTGDPNPLRSRHAPFWPSYGSSGGGNKSEGESVGFDVLSITYKTIGAEKDPDAGPQCDFFSSRGHQLSN